jgi:hypothetical protein
MHPTRIDRALFASLLAGAIALTLGQARPAAAETPGIVFQHGDGTRTVLSVDAIRKLVPGNGTIAVIQTDGTQTTFDLAALHGMQTLASTVAVGPGPIAPRPASIRLLQNRPNPMVATTRIGFEVPERAHVTLEIFSVAGRRIRTLVDREIEAGHHEVPWDRTDAGGRRVGAGVYLYRLRGLGAGQARRLVLLP